jgi:hypothetical protein
MPELEQEVRGVRASGQPAFKQNFSASRRSLASGRKKRRLHFRVGDLKGLSHQIRFETDLVWFSRPWWGHLNLTLIQVAGAYMTPINFEQKQLKMA